MNRLTHCDWLLHNKKRHTAVTDPVVIHLMEEIDTSLVQKISRQINEAQRTRQPFLPVVINAPGGDVYDSLHIVELLRTCGLPVHTIGFGLVASGAAFVFTCGTERWLAPTAKFMVHDVSADVDGNLSGAAMRIEADEMTHLKQIMCEQMATNVGQPKTYFSDLIHSRGNVDVYLTAADCLERHIATHVGVPTLCLDISVSLRLVAAQDVVEEDAHPTEVVEELVTTNNSKRKRK